MTQPDPKGEDSESSDSQSNLSPDSDTQLLRILDAAANRAGEGLRVAEDYVRFALDDRHLTELCKTLRHELAAIVGDVSSLSRHRARDTQEDVGTRVSTTAESRRESIWDVSAAALKRTQQALRSLEEFSKTFSSSLPNRFESIRYQTYTLERCLDINRHSRRILTGARLYVLIDGQTSSERFTELVRSLVAGGADLIQLRDKRLDDRQLSGRARLLRELTRGADTLMIVNDRPDIAALSDADGVHVGQEELSVKDARAIVGHRRLIGVSTHTLEQLRAAVLAGADYLGVGPVFPSETKSFERFPGVEYLIEAAQETTLPTFAIGGVTLKNLDRVLATGVRRVAVGSAITNADDPRKATRELSAELNRY